ncbi:hypothetical protein RF11_09495 [Thelohanellus kitauei]|uniref:Uncharacterized protein n=1 Tax=Thelohanellus kitauei TaxID=669202 RepID=A0A0C2MVN7_THEKT|nr:hypothetical protein RF11_09495 [Thelohanellus kitauei]
MIDPIIPFDGLPIYYSINYISKEMIIGKDGRVISESSQKQSTNLIITTDANGRKEDILREYKPVLPTEIILDRRETAVDLIIPHSAHHNQSIDYTIVIKNMNKNHLHMLTVFVDLVNATGKKMLDNHVYFHSESFKNDSYTFLGKTKPWKVERPTNLSLSTFVWNLKLIDVSTNQLINIEKVTSILPCFDGYFEIPRQKIGLGMMNFDFRIKNLLEIEANYITIIFYQNGFTWESSAMLDNIPALGEKTVSGNVFVKVSFALTLAFRRN